MLVLGEWQGLIWLLVNGGGVAVAMAAAGGRQFAVYGRLSRSHHPFAGCECSAMLKDLLSC